MATCLGQQLGQAHEQGKAVRQAGQRIVLGDMAHALFGLFALGDVGQNPDVIRWHSALRIVHWRVQNRDAHVAGLTKTTRPCYILFLHRVMNVQIY